MYCKIWKRLFDIVLSLIGILIFSVPMLVVSVLIKLDSKGPVIFTQKRIAIHKGYFNCHKFRSMPTSIPSDVPTHLFKAADQLSGFQKTIRKYSVDELPQLFDILAGKMSIVGPRPALWNQYDLIEERDRYGANDVTPGLTGWAQVNGRDELSIEEKSYFDGVYTKTLKKGGFKAFLLDCKCIFMTVYAVIGHKGVTECKIKESDTDTNKTGVQDKK